MSQQSGNGAPQSFGGLTVIRVADTSPTLAVGNAYMGVPTTTRTYTLPLLSTVQDGAQIRVTNRSAGANSITVTAAGTEQINDTGTPGTVTVAQNANVLLIAKVIDGATPASWMSF